MLYFRLFGINLGEGEDTEFGERPMKIREETTGDRSGIREVVVASFAGTAEADLIDALRDAGDDALSLVAEEPMSGRTVGHVLFSKLRTPEGCLALAPLSVAPGAQKQGIGSRLMEEGLQRARRGGWRAVFVLGEPDYYRRFGFTVEAAAPFDTPYPKDYFMALELSPGSLADLSGPVVYAPAFEDLE